MKSGMAKVGVWLLVTLVAFTGGLWWAKRKQVPPITTFRELTGKYFIDTDVHCTGPDGKPGKNLGKVTVDLDLRNGKLIVVRNDPGKYPTCP